MAVYRRKADAARGYSSYKWKAPLVFVIFIGIAVICRYSELFWAQRLFPIAAIGALFSFGFIFAVHYGFKNMMTLQIELTGKGVLRSGGPQRDLFLSRKEITGYTEGKNGILLRTADPMRRIAIPSDLERYEELRSELAGVGITQISREGIDPLWDLALVLAGCLILFVVIAGSGRSFVNENLYVAGWLLVLVGIGHAAWRKRLSEHRTLLLLHLSLLAVLITLELSLARNSGTVAHRLYFEVFYLLAVALFIASLFKLGYDKWSGKRKT